MAHSVAALERVLTWVCPFLEERDLTMLAASAKTAQPLLHRDRLWMTLLVRAGAEDVVWGGAGVPTACYQAAGT